MQVLLYLTFLAGAAYFSYLLFFPTQSFDFFFRTPQATKNTVIRPRNENNKSAENGQVKQGETLIFDTPSENLAVNFSQAAITLVPEKGYSFLLQGTITVRKSFQAFFYPLGEPIGFKDGNLITASQNYYIVSQGHLRKFASLRILNSLGYKPEMFQEVSNEELLYNEKGDDIASAENYPDGALFKISEDYYQFKNGQLHKFVSTQAFLSNFDGREAIPETEQFLNRYAVSEDLLGFQGGTLLSSAGAVFVVNNGTLAPIGDEIIFASMGYDWADVMPATEEELAIYKKSKIFTVASSHPDGTIFSEKETGNYYIIDNGTKREIKGEHILKSYLRNTPILVDAKGLDAKSSCTVGKKFSIFTEYDCAVPLNGINTLAGNDYQFEMKLGSDLKINALNVTFSRALTWQNLRLTLSDIKKKLTLQYGK